MVILEMKLLPTECCFLSLASVGLCSNVDNCKKVNACWDIP